MAAKTDEQRLKDLQAKIDKRKKVAEAKANLEQAKATLKKLRSK